MKFALPLFLAASLFAAPVRAEADPEVIAKAAECSSTYAVQASLFMATATSLLAYSAGAGSNDDNIGSLAASALEASVISQQHAIAILGFAKANGFPQSFAKTSATMAQQKLNRAIGATFGLGGEVEDNFKLLADIHAKGTECDAWMVKTVLPPPNKPK